MAAGSTYTPIATTTLGSAQTSVSFSSFSGYTDLRLVIANAGASSGDSNIIFRFNGDSGSNYSVTNVGARSLSTTPFSARQGVGYGNLNWYTAIGSQKGMVIADFMNYSNATTFKTTLVSCRVDEGNGTYSGVEDSVVLWRNTGAITSLVLSIFSGANFTTGSTFTLYGIAAA
jgi:hypothetical protein